MADKTIIEFDEITTVASGDKIVLVDIDDDSASDAGTNKWATKDNFLKEYATLVGEETLTNKRLVSPKINEDVTLSSTATELNQLDGVEVGGSSGGDIVTTDDTQTVTGKTIDGDDNTLQDIASESLKTTVAFDAYLTSSVSIPSGSFTTIVWDSESGDVGSDFSLSTGKFVAPVDGWYHFDTSVSFSASTGNWCQVMFISDSSYLTANRIASLTDTGSNTAMGGGRTFRLDAGEYCAVQFYQNSGSPMDIIHARSYFSGFLIGTI
jgi:hypothetical protein